MAGSGSWGGRTHFYHHWVTKALCFKNLLKNEILSRALKGLEHVGASPVSFSASAAGPCAGMTSAVALGLLQEGRAGREWSSVPANEVSCSLGTQASGQHRVTG